MQIDPFGRLAAKVVRCDRLVAVCRNCGMDLAKYHRRFISLSFIYIVLTIITLAIAVKKKTDRSKFSSVLLLRLSIKQRGNGKRNLNK